MSQSKPRALTDLWALIHEVPAETTHSLCERFRGIPATTLGKVQPTDLGPVPNARAASLLCAAGRECLAAGLVQDADGLVRLLRSMSLTAQTDHTGEVTELVWTGPQPEESVLRRTDQALQEVIHAATRQLLLVSFAVYKVGHLSTALRGALERGADVNIVLEDQKESAPVVSMMAEFEGLQGISFYVWPEDKRQLAPSGHKGAMHAKCAVADEHMLLVSSANLTEHALNINMEMGLLVRQGPAPRAVARHFEALMRGGTLVRLV